jgi:regulator of sigma E protease
LGIFFAAKITGMKVEEFGVGYPPRLWGKKFGQTLYSINWLPLGGFVKIKGEDGDVTATDQSQEVNGNAFTDKNHFAQLFVLVAGVVMNMVLAYVLLSTVLMMGIPRALYGEDIAKAESTQLVVAGVLPGSPAESAGLLQGDIITKAFAGDAEFSSVKVEDFITFINATESGEPVALSLSRNDEAVMISAIPAEGVIESDVNKKALGVSLATVGGG